MNLEVYIRQTSDIRVIDLQVRFKLAAHMSVIVYDDGMRSTQIKIASI